MRSLGFLFCFLALLGLWGCWRVDVSTCDARCWEQVSPGEPVGGEPTEQQVDEALKASWVEAVCSGSKQPAMCPTPEGQNSVQE